VPRFYFRVVTERGHGRRLAAVCYGLVEGGGETARFTVLLVDEWGEKEILRKVKDLGLFELGQAFIPLGPRLKEDFSLTVSRAISNGILVSDEESAVALINKKLSESQVFDDGGHETPQDSHPGRERNKQLVQRLCAEGESFLKRHAAPS
jgi:hypothetical protein